MKVDLTEKKRDIALLGTDLFNKITGLPESIRTDEKKRTGIQILVREPGTRNLVVVAVFDPSDAARFFSIEKAVRSYIKGDFASQNSENPDDMEFAGSVTACIEGMTIQVSVSGLKAEEDVTVAILVLASIFKVKPRSVIKNIRSNGGMLPRYLSLKSHYLSHILDQTYN